MAIILLFTGLNLHKIRGYIIFDRIDLHIEVTPVPFKKLSEMKPGESSAVIRERVIAARKIQEERFRGHAGIHCNAWVSSRLSCLHCQF